jgi:hypothetical protein
VDKGKTLAGIGFGLGAYGIWGFFRCSSASWAT